MKAETLETRLKQIEKLRQPILAAGDEAQQLRRLPHGIVEQLVEEGFFRFALPSALGGEEASSMDTIVVLEALAAIDASVAWNVRVDASLKGAQERGLAVVAAAHDQGHATRDSHAHEAAGRVGYGQCRSAAVFRSNSRARQ